MSFSRKPRKPLVRSGFKKRSGKGLRRIRWMKARNAQRKAKEFARTYGSEDRVTFVKGLPCLLCGRTPSENAHLGNGGMSRKADADQIVPLCGDFENGCHRKLDEWPGSRESFERAHAAPLWGLSLAQWAESVEADWQGQAGQRRGRVA